MVKYLNLHAKNGINERHLNRFKATTMECFFLSDLQKRVYHTYNGSAHLLQKKNRQIVKRDLREYSVLYYLEPKILIYGLDGIRFVK